MHDSYAEESAGTRYLRRRMALLTGCVGTVCLAILGALGFSFWQYAAGNSKERQREAITDVIERRNRILGEALQVEQEQSRNDERVYDPPGSVRRLAAQLRGIATRLCPDDFREGYLKYCQALDDLADALESLPKTELQATLQGFLVLNGLLGRSDGGFGDAIRELKQATRAFRATEHDLELIMLRYDITLKPPVGSRSERGRESD